MDQSLSYYQITRKTYRWHKKFTLYLLQISMLNAFILYKARNPEGACKSLLQFMDRAIKGWTRPVRGAIPARIALEAPPGVHHVPVHHPPIAGGGAREHASRSCWMCKEGKNDEEVKRRRSSVFWCAACQVTLCRGVCFRRYHSENNISLD